MKQVGVKVLSSLYPFFKLDIISLVQLISSSSARGLWNGVVIFSEGLEEKKIETERSLYEISKKEHTNNKDLNIFWPR